MAIQYLNSSSIKAYPTDNRGKDESTNAMFNPESHYYSESNANKVGGTEIATRKSFAYETGDSLLIVIDGYRFDMSKSELISLVGSPALGDSLYAGIRVVEGDQTNHEFSQLAQVISNGAFGTILDYKASGDSDYRFYGLAFSKSQSELTSNGATSTLQVFACETAGTWEIPDASKIVLSTDRIAQYVDGTLSTKPITQEFTTETLKAETAEVSNGEVVHGDMTADNITVRNYIKSPTIAGNSVDCITAGSEQIKEVTLDGFTIKGGAVLNVRFTYTNSFSASSSNPLKLRIKDSGGNTICTNSLCRYQGQSGLVQVGVTPATSWNSRDTVTLVMSGSSSNAFWVILGSNRVSQYAEVQEDASNGLYPVGVSTSNDPTKELKKNTSIMFKKGDMTLDSVTAKEQINSPTITGNYATCSSAASTADKLINLIGFVPVVGAVINVKFTNKNTAGSPRLKVQTSTGVYSYINIMQNNGASVAGVDKYSSWGDGDVVSFVVIDVPVTGNPSCVMTKPLNVLNALNDGDGNKINSTYAHSINNSVADGVNTIDLLDRDGTVLDSVDVDTVASALKSDKVKMEAKSTSNEKYYPLLRNSNSTAGYDPAYYTTKFVVTGSTGAVYSPEYHGELSSNETVCLKLDQSGVSVKDSGGSENIIRLSTYNLTVGNVVTKWSSINTNKDVVGFAVNVYPTVSNLYSLGSSSYKWKNMYVSTVNATTVNATNFYGNTSLTNGTVMSQTRRDVTLKSLTTIEFNNINLTVGKRYMVEFSIEVALGNDDLVGDSFFFPILYFHEPNGGSPSSPGTRGDYRSKVSVVINADDLGAPDEMGVHLSGVWLVTFIPGTGSNTNKSKIQIIPISAGSGSTSSCELTVIAREVR